MAISEGTPGDGQGAPESTGTPGDGQGQEFDYRQGYDQLRPKFTQTTQELSQAQASLTEYEDLFEALHDPDRQAEALAVLGFEPAAEGAPQGADADLDEFVDPLEAEIKELRGTVDELRSQREQEAEQNEREELLGMRDDYIGQAISFIEEQTGRKFSEKQERVLGNLAIANETDDGVPDVQTAYNLLYGEDGVVELERSNWIDTKTGAFAAPGGRSAELKKPETASERASYIDERMAQLDRQR